MCPTLLTNLSNDVLRIIFSFVAEHGNDIEQLARTCRLLRSVAVPFIQKHRYAHVSDSNPRIVQMILRDLILDPHVAKHVRSLEVTDLVPSLIHRHVRRLEAQVYKKAVEMLIPKESQELWMKEIENGNDDPLKALVILLSPQMTAVDWEVHNIRGWRRWEGGNIHFFDYLRETKSTLDIRPPINIEFLSIHMHKAPSAKEVINISDLLPILTLPKLTTLILSDVQGPFGFPQASFHTIENEIHRTSLLKVLEIKNSCLSAEGLNTILSGIVALEKLECRISDNDGGYSSGHTDSLGQLLKAIEINTSHSLKSLNLIGNDTHGIIGGGHTLPSLPTLNTFTSLIHLKLNPIILTTSFILTPQPLSDPSTSTPQPDIDIASLLPPNLEILEIEGLIRKGESARNVICKVEEILGGKDMYVKNLKEIIVRDVGGDRGAWEKEEKLRLKRECLRWGVVGDFRNNGEVEIEWA